MDRRDHLRQQLRTLHKEFQRQAQPIVDRLAAIEALQPLPMVIDLNLMDPAMRMQLERLHPLIPRHHGTEPESPQAKARRIEREHAVLVRLLRLVRDNVQPTAMPGYLSQSIETTLKSME